MAGIEWDESSVMGIDRATFRPEGSAAEVRRQRRVGLAAAYLGVSRATIERLVGSGELPIVKGDFGFQRGLIVASSAQSGFPA